MKLFVEVKKDLASKLTPATLPKGTVLPVLEERTKSKHHRYLVKSGPVYWFLSSFQGKLVKG